MGCGTEPLTVGSDSISRETVSDGVKPQYTQLVCKITPFAETCSSRVRSGVVLQAVLRVEET